MGRAMVCNKPRKMRLCAADHTQYLCSNLIFAA